MSTRARGRPHSEWQPLEALIPADLLKAETRAWADRIGVRVRALHVRPMRRKWASCSTNGRITLDAGLLAEPPEFRTEVVVHELLHLQVGNHGKLFRSLLRAYLGREPTTLHQGRAKPRTPPSERDVD